MNDLERFNRSRRRTQYSRRWAAVVILQGMRHNVINVGDDELKLYILYSPLEHLEATHQKDKPI
jgi:oxalate decarboxylase/phosphoglucose isomerase-like protein (cupin superfamily)